MKNQSLMIRLLLLPVLAASVALPARARADEDTVLAIRKWGALTVTTTPAPENRGPDDKAHLKILDKAGKVLIDLSDVMVVGTTFHEINGGGLPELEVNLFSGGLHCCLTNIVFTQDGGFHRLLDLPGDNIEGIAGVKDLNRDGKPEIIVWDTNTWAYYGGLSFAASPFMPLIIGWNGSRYVNQTARFPQRSLEAAKRDQADLLKSPRKAPKGDKPVWREERRHSAALGYYANMLVVGKGAEAKAWLRKHAPRETVEWLSEHEREIRRTMAAWLKAGYSPKPLKPAH